MDQRIAGFVDGRLREVEGYQEASEETQPQGLYGALERALDLADAAEQVPADELEAEAGDEG